MFRAARRHQTRSSRSSSIGIRRNVVAAHVPLGEVHLEDRLEGLPVRVVFHHGGGQRVLERIAVVERERARRASTASRFSVRLTGDDRPWRSSALRTRTSTLEEAGARGERRFVGHDVVGDHPLSDYRRAGVAMLMGYRLLEAGLASSLDRLLDVALVLEQDVEGGGRPPRPISPIGDARAAAGCAPSPASRRPTAPFSTPGWRMERTMRTT